MRGNYLSPQHKLVIWIVSVFGLAGAGFKPSILTQQTQYVEPMVDQRPRRWANIESTLV